MEAKTGPGFEFVVKAYRGITHDLFLNNCPGSSAARNAIKLKEFLSGIDKS